MDDSELNRRVAAIAGDRLAGAQELGAAAIALLRDGLARGTVGAVAPRVCRAQPAMAPLWNAALRALASREAPDRFEAFVRRLERAPASLVRVASDFFSGDAWPLASGALHVVTFSRSRSVYAILQALRRTRPLHVSVSESRPGLEGRALAASVASLDVVVACYTDAALAHALDAADAVLVGADAVGPRAFINKSGTAMLAAAAWVRQVPVYVAATRDKLVMPALWPLLVAPDSPAAEVWDAPPAGVTVRNPCFEPVPHELVAGIITDFGILSPDMLPEACQALQDQEMLGALQELLAS